MTDLNLVERCLARDESAWRSFFHRFKSRIEQRIKQVFARYGYRHSDMHFRDAFDHVVDQFVFNRALAGYRQDSSLDGFVLTVTARATIDWYRQAVTEKKLYGIVDQASSLDDTRLESLSSESYEISIDFEKRLTADECIIVRLLAIRHRDLSESAVTGLSRISGRNEHQVQQRVAVLQSRLQEKNMEAEQRFAKLQILFLQLQALRHRDADPLKIKRKQQQYDRLLAVYRKQGFEILPTRNELAEIFRWDVNKIDRALRKIKEKMLTPSFSEEKSVLRRSISRG